MLTDPIADMLARINNGYAARHKVVEVPYSKIKQGIAELLIAEKYLVSTETIGDSVANKRLKLALRYQQKDPAIRKMRRISKPGRRVYHQAKQLTNPLSGLGTAIVSTSKGLMTAKQAKAKKLGGELICEVW